jgi:DNA-binding protein HU-beta
MNKKELVQAVAERVGSSPSEVDAVLKAMVDEVTEKTAAGDTVTIQGFVKIQKVDRPARTGRNPQTGEEMQIPAGSGVKVTALAGLKNAVRES